MKQENQLSLVERQRVRIRLRLNRVFLRGARATDADYYLPLEYAPSARSSSRTRSGGPLHDVIAAGEPKYRRSLVTIASFSEDLAQIPSAVDDDRTPSWINGYIPGLDGAAIYAFLRSRHPGTYLEIGSGNSTRFARRAVADGDLPTRIVSIDPSPRTEVDALCDEIIRQPLELTDPHVFAGLKNGDVVFLDGSHRVFTGSDATIFFCELLPTLPAGVLVGIHDIFLPDDYPDEWADRHYSEQYLLASLLLGQPSWLRLVLAANYVTKRPALADELAPLWKRLGLTGMDTSGGGFWVEVAE